MSRRAPRGPEGWEERECTGPGPRRDDPSPTARRERLAQIAAGLAPEGDLDELRRGAHSLKSSAANVGALRVSALAAELEQAADAGDRAACEGLRSSLVQEQAEAEARLSRVVEELA
ncbi:MAG: Hpt domain-containing protein [Gemmatimonadota bacterium]